MDKQIYLAISSRLKSLVPDLNWIDYDWGQLNDERPAVAFPCALIDIAYTDCKNLAEESLVEQMVSGSITLKLAFQPQGESQVTAPNASRDAALKPLDTIASVHSALQGWNGNGMFRGLSRKKGSGSPRKDKLKVYNLVYETNFINTPD
jgi:hypothetical protein